MTLIEGTVAKPDPTLLPHVTAALAELTRQAPDLSERDTAPHESGVASFALRQLRRPRFVTIR